MDEPGSLKRSLRFTRSSLGRADIMEVDTDSWGKEVEDMEAQASLP